MNDNTTNIPVELSNGAVILIETSYARGEEEVSEGIMPKFQEIVKSIEGIAKEMDQLIQKVKPKEASVEFGVEIGIESGQLTTLLVKGTGKANAKITLTWGK